MSFTISITPAQHGWTLQGDTLEAGMMFLSGAAAESAARTLALSYARVGRETEIRIFLRDGSLAGRFVCGPQTIAGGS
jgi:hypothetical protein